MDFNENQTLDVKVRNYDDREYDNTAGSAAVIGIIQHTHSGKSPVTVIQGSTDNLPGEIVEDKT